MGRGIRLGIWFGTLSVSQSSVLYIYLCTLALMRASCPQTHNIDSLEIFLSSLSSLKYTRPIPNNVIVCMYALILDSYF